jgi:Domain of unknown function (DUF6894)
MPRFYFHLSNSNECFRDDIGRDLTNLAAAHTRAQRLAHRVMKISGLASSKPDWGRLTVTVTDDHNARLHRRWSPPERAAPFFPALRWHDK